MGEQKKRKLAAIMFTDIVGYTAIMQGDEQAAINLRTRHRQEFRKYHEAFNGQILQYYGDGTLSIFQSGVEAVECAIAIQKELTRGDRVPIRVGLHVGDIVVDGTEVYGDGVNLASRIESMGVAGAILLSAKLNDDLKNHANIVTSSLGHFEFKNVQQPVEIFSVTNDGIVHPQASELKGKLKKHHKSIAVLPFVNMSSSEETEYFTDGMTEEIINALSKIKGLEVTSRTSSFFFKGKNLPVAEIGQKLNVSTILEGSIRLSGEMMRITAQLINTSDDAHFWSEKWDRKVENVFEIQDEISLLIAEKLREHIGHFNIEDHLVRLPEIPVEAYKTYLKGRYHLLKYNLPDAEKGIAILEALTKEYPEFPLAYLDINLGYAFMGAIGIMPAEEAFSKGKHYLDRAIELDPDLPECQYGLAGLSYWHQWDLDAAFRHINKALELRPGYADAHQTMAPFLMTIGQFDAAMIYIDKAIQLDPFSAINYHMKGLIFSFRESFEQAIPYFEKATSLDPNFILSKLVWANSLLLLGKAEESRAIYMGLPQDKFGQLSKLGGITLVEAFLGNKAKAEEGIVALEAAMQTDSMGWAVEYLMLCHMRMGNMEKAIESIEFGIKHRFPMMITLAADPMFKPLRSNARFHELMTAVMGEKHFKAVSEGIYGQKGLSENSASKIPTRNEQPKKALLDESAAKGISKKLLELIETQEPHLQANMSLKMLADLMDVHPNQLSWLLNNHFGKSFNDFINHYRIEAFKRLALDPESAHITLIGLAYESGFNSKTVFNTYFKKETGMTPKAWIKSARA